MCRSLIQALLKPPYSKLIAQIPKPQLLPTSHTPHNEGSEFLKDEKTGSRKTCYRPGNIAKMVPKRRFIVF